MTDTAAADRTGCRFPGCLRPVEESKGTGRPLGFCDDDAHNKASAFKERRRLEREEAISGGRQVDENQAKPVDYSTARARHLLTIAHQIANDQKRNAVALLEQLGVLTDPGAVDVEIDTVRSEADELVGQAESARLELARQLAAETQRREEAEDLTTEALEAVTVAQVERDDALQAVEEAKAQALADVESAQTEAAQTIATAEAEMQQQIDQTQTEAETRVTTAEGERDDALQAVEEAKAQALADVESAQTEAAQTIATADTAAQKKVDDAKAEAAKAAKATEAAQEERDEAKRKETRAREEAERDRAALDRIRDELEAERKAWHQSRTDAAEERSRERDDWQKQLEAANNRARKANTDADDLRIKLAQLAQMTPTTPAEPTATQAPVEPAAAEPATSSRRTRAGK